MIEILKPGFFTSIQDAGRFHFRRYGIPESGCMDRWAYAVVNRLLGNDANTPVLECTLSGPSIKFTANGYAALSGAKMNAHMNGKPVETECVIPFRKGDELRLGHATHGARCYIGIRGKWNIKPVFGSSATYTPAAIGGIDGTALKRGDFLEIKERTQNFAQKQLSSNFRRYFGRSIEIRFTKGAEWERAGISENQIHKLRCSVASESNRMGIRLKPGEPVAHTSFSMLSSPVLPGTIQLPPGGQPIILMRDAQTVGGYPRIGQVPDSDLDRMAQLQPGDEVRFRCINSAEAEEIEAEYKNRIALLKRFCEQ